MTRKIHIVVCCRTGSNTLCLTDTGQPAVYDDPAFAELHAAQLRDKYPGLTFRCIESEVL